jgi:hypothetical protein
MHRARDPERRLTGLCAVDVQLDPVSGMSDAHDASWDRWSRFLGRWVIVIDDGSIPRNPL